MTQSALNWLSDRSLSRRKLLRGGTVAAAGLAAASLIGCGGDDEVAPTGGPSGSGGTSTPTAASPTPAAATQLTDATLTAAIANDIGSGDPQSLGGTGGGNWPNTSTHWEGGGLLQVDPETGDFVGDLAEEWEIVDGGMGHRFKLLPGLKFHNGEPINSEAVKFSMDRQLGKAEYNPAYKGGYAGQFASFVEDIEIVDDLNFTIRMQKPDIVFPARLGSFFLVPPKLIQEQGDDAFAASPVGTGAFKFVSRRPDAELVSERYDDYHRAPGEGIGSHLPFVKHVVQKVVPDSQARIAALEAGEVDLVHNVPSDLSKQLEGDDRFKVFYLPSTQPMHIKMNSVPETDPITGGPNPWRDVRVRKAANLAIDLDTIMKSLLTGREQPSFGVSSRAFGFPEDIRAQRWGFDPQQAKALLTEAGFANGFEAILWGPTGRWPDSRPVMEAIAQYLTEVGIRTQVRELAYGPITEQIKDRSIYPLVFFGASGSSEPGYALTGAYTSSGNFNLSMPIPETEDLIARSSQEFDLEKRRGLLQQVIKRLYVDDVQVIYLYEPVTAVVADKKWEWDIFGTNVSNPEYWRIRPA